MYIVFKHLSLKNNDIYIPILILNTIILLLKEINVCIYTIK